MFLDRSSKTPIKETPKEAWDNKLYIDKLTHTYQCEICRLEYKFDPNDKRKCNCPYHNGYYLVKSCSRCHCYETMVPIKCPDCGVEHYPTDKIHQGVCKAQECTSCGKRAYENACDGWSGNYTKPTGVKIVPGQGKCLQCFKDEALLEALNNLTVQLQKLNAKK